MHPNHSLFQALYIFKIRYTLEHPDGFEEIAVKYDHC